MSRFLVRKLFTALVMLWGVLTIAFFLMHLSGDPVSLMIEPNAPPEAIEKIRSRLGLDQPLIVQYGNFLSDVALRGDFGISLRQGISAFHLVIDRLPATLELALAGVFVSTVVGVPLGILAAVRRGTILEVGILSSALVGQSVPSFWLGLMMILVFGVFFQILPISGRGGLEHLIMPAIALAVTPIAKITRLLRSSMLEQLEQDFIRTARAKGLSSLVVTVKHVLRNAAIPVVTFIGLDFGRMMGGAVIIETVFAWPGAGLLTINAVFQRDFPIVQAAVFVMGLVFVLVALLLDLIYVLLDPRIRFE